MPDTTTHTDRGRLAAIAREAASAARTGDAGAEVRVRSGTLQFGPQDQRDAYLAGWHAARAGLATMQPLTAEQYELLCDAVREWDENLEDRIRHGSDFDGEEDYARSRVAAASRALEHLPHERVEV